MTTGLATALVIMLCLTAPLVALAEVTSLVLLAIFAAINLAVIALRGDGDRTGFKAPRWVAYVGVSLSLLALIWGLAA